MKISFVAFALSLAVAQALHSGDVPEPPTDHVHFQGAGCVDYHPTEAGDWTLLAECDDCINTVDLGFTFDAFGTPTTTMDVSSNGFIGRSIDDSGVLSGMSSSVYNSGVIAPLYGDVYTWGFRGEIFYKQLPGERFALTWHEVADYSNYSNRNTFQVVISGANSIAPQVCFCYEELSWAYYDGRVEIGVRNNPGDPTWAMADFDRSENLVGGIFPSETVLDDLEYRSFCFNLDNLPTSAADAETTTIETFGAGNDPHFKTWKGEHFEYHGQCDLVLAKDEEFAEGLGLDIQIRTKLVRYWSYIKTAVIRIGNDILEIEGSSMEGVDKELHYWSNYEYQGELTEFAGFPVNIKSDGTKLHKNVFEIDLSSKYPGQKIIIKTFKEFVKVDFVNPTEKSFGKTVGMLGDFKTGKTLARDGVTVLDDYTDLGREWQVLPSDKKLFREASEPQFPALCIEPEDPRGERRRRLESSSISEEEAEAACAGLKDELDRKDCVYDILATQDLDMAGAF